MSNIRELLSIDPAAMSSIFTPASMGGKLSGRAVLSTYQGPGREAVLGLLERTRVLPGGVADAVRSGATPIEIGRSVNELVGSQLGGGGTVAGRAGSRTLGMVGGGAAGSGFVMPPGLYIQAKLIDHARRTGIPLELLVGSVPAGAATPAAGVATPAAGAVAPIVDDAARVVANLDAQAFLSDALEHLGKVDHPTRMDIMSEFFAARARAGKGEPLEMLMARNLIETPIDDAAFALDEAFAKIAARGVGEAAPVVDDLARVAPALARSAPLMADVLPQTAKLAGKLTPTLFIAAHGAAGMARLEPAIMQAVKLLPKI